MPSLATSLLTTSALSSPLTNRDRTCCRRAHSPDRSACSRAAAHDLYVLTSLLLRDKSFARSTGDARMSTIVHYECRNLDHLRAGSRRGNGGLVIHHGSVGYCDGLHVDGAHRWVATGGVPIEFLVESAPSMDAGTYRTSDGALVHIRTSPTGKMVVEADDPRGKRADLRVAVKLSDDPDWPDGSAAHMTLLHAD